MTITYTPIGHVRSPFESPDEVAHDAVSETEGRIVLDDEYSRGLTDLDEFSHVVVLAHLDEIDDTRLRAHPPHADDLEVGLFATRSPHRPNPIAQTTVELVDRDDATLHVRGLDLVDGTPVLDIKPYVRSVPESADTAFGWLDDVR